MLARVSSIVIKITFLCYTIYSLDCDNGSCDSTSGFTCSSFNCEVNCYDSTGCAGKSFITTDTGGSNHTLTANCYGDSSCAGMTITSSGRNAYINCYGHDSCDDLTVDFTGTDPNNPVEFIINLQGQYTDTVRIDCKDSGSEPTISLCEVNCIDPPLGGFYTCIDVDLACNTIGNCHYSCASSNACCGCSLLDAGGLINTLHENRLDCNHGDRGGNNTSNCIQVWCL